VNQEGYVAQGRRMNEGADDYPAVVAQLNANWRVIVCGSGIQWILQRCDGERHGRARWAGRSFCRTSEALRCVCRKHVGTIDPVAAAILAALPEWIEERATAAEAPDRITEAAE
jgi:hypothetical protein